MSERANRGLIAANCGMSRGVLAGRAGAVSASEFAELDPRERLIIGWCGRERFAPVTRRRRRRAMEKRFGVVSADGHCRLMHLPFDLWTKRLPRRFQDDGPRVVKRPDGTRQWIV